MTTIAEAISRVRNTLKAVKDDAFLTDRTIYFSILKYGKTLLKREDNQNRLMKMSSLFTTLSYVELIEVDKIEASCAGIKSGCVIKRSKEKIPQMFDGMFGPLFRTVSSIDGETELFRTEPGTYVSMTKTSSFKFNNRIYFWYLNGYLYFPNMQWDAVKVEGIFEGNLGDFICDPKENCRLKQDHQLPFPEYIFSEVEQFVLKELTMTASIPSDGADNNQNTFR
jgi:hypothetical protein